jgi:hypothetical protein
MKTQTTVTTKTPVATTKKNADITAKKPELERGNPLSTTLVAAGKKAAKRNPVTAAAVAASVIPAANAEKRAATPEAAKPEAKKKAVEKKPADTSLKIRLYAKGEFYFGKNAAARVNGLPYIAVAVKGKTVTLTPTKSEKDAVKVMFCHASPVLRVAKLLADTGWNKQTQDLVAKPVGEAGFTFEIA